MKPKHSPNKILGLVFIAIILIAGGTYFWKSKEEEDVSRNYPSAPVTQEDSKELEALMNELDAGAEGEINVDHIE